MSGSPTRAGQGTLRAVVVDDERHARQLVCEYLEAIDDVEVVAVCANGFEAVFDKIRTRAAQPSRDAPSALDAVVEAGRRRPRRRILVRDGARVEVIPTGRVRYLEARGDYVRIVHADGEIDKKTTLTELADELDPDASSGSTAPTSSTSTPSTASSRTPRTAASRSSTTAAGCR